MTHLSPEEVSGWILGESSPEIEQHVQSCGRCHEDIVRMQDGLRVFKRSVHGWAGRAAQHATPGISAHPAGRRVFWRWAAVCAAAISVALLPLYLDVRQAQRQAKNAEDSLLLKQVQQHLARPVPQSMTHLMELMSKREEGPQ